MSSKIQFPHRLTGNDFKHDKIAVIQFFSTYLDAAEAARDYREMYDIFVHLESLIDKEERHKRGKSEYYSEFMLKNAINQEVEKRGSEGSEDLL